MTDEYTTTDLALQAIQSGIGELQRELPLAEPEDGAEIYEWLLRMIDEMRALAADAYDLSLGVDDD